MNKFTLLIGSLSLIALAGGVQAQDYPSQPITWVVPFAPGGLSDSVARILAEAMQADLGQSVLVDNKPGGATFIGAEFLANSASDGYHVGSLDVGTLVLNQGLFSQMPYDPHADFEIVGGMVRHPFVVTAHPSFEANTIAELVAYAKANPGAVNFGSAGNGSAHHIAAEAIFSGFGIEGEHIPYQGSAPAMQDLIGGQIDILLNSPSGVTDLLADGRIKVLGVTSSERMEMLPDVPTIAESGLDGFEAYSWQTMGTANGAPGEIVERLATSLRTVLAEPAIIERLAGMGLEVLPLGPQEIDTYIASEEQFWLPVMSEIGLEKK